MSKGFGAVQRKIAEVLAKDIDDAFRVDELCREVYGNDLPEKKQRVSVIRAVPTSRHLRLLETARLQGERRKALRPGSPIHLHLAREVQANLAGMRLYERADMRRLRQHFIRRVR